MENWVVTPTHDRELDRFLILVEEYSDGVDLFLFLVETEIC